MLRSAGVAASDAANVNLPSSTNARGAPSIRGSRGAYRFKQLASSPSRWRNEANLTPSSSGASDAVMPSASRPAGVSGS